GADVPEPGRAEHGVRQRMRDHVAIRMAGEPARMLEANAAEHERHAVLERVGVDADPDAELAHASHEATSSRSARSVIFSRRGSPSTTFTRPPRASTRPAQSVAPRSGVLLGPRAARSVAAGKACG